jgi:hypothetical protein
MMIQMAAQEEPNAQCGVMRGGIADNQRRRIFTASQRAGRGFGGTIFRNFVLTKLYGQGMEQEGRTCCCRRQVPTMATIARSDEGRSQRCGDEGDWYERMRPLLLVVSAGGIKRVGRQPSYSGFIGIS